MTSDELLLTDAGLNTCAEFGVACWFSLFFWGFSWWWNQQLIENMWEMILALVSVHGGAPLLPYFYSLLYPSFKSVLLRADNLCLPPSNDTTVLNHMVRDDRSAHHTQWLSSPPPPPPPPWRYSVLPTLLTSVLCSSRRAPNPLPASPT